MKAHVVSAPRLGLLVAATVVLAAAVALAQGAPARSSTPPVTAASGISQSAAKPDTLPHRVVAYYFHTTQRCVSCRRIEAYSREAIEAAFPGDLRTGRLTWQVINVEEKGNEHFVKDYQLYTKSLVLVDEARGRQVQWKNLEKVWQLLNDKPAFLRYVQDETRAYLAPRS